MIPRRPNNMFFNVATPSDWTSEYNCLYETYWGKKLSYEEILDFESQQLLTYMLQGDMDPWMFHQTNMNVHSFGRTLLTDLLDRTFAKYTGYFRLAVLSPSMEQIAALMKARMDLRRVSGLGDALSRVAEHLGCEQQPSIPVTGASVPGAEKYGGQSIGRVEVKAGETISIPLP